MRSSRRVSVAGREIPAEPADGVGDGGDLAPFPLIPDLDGGGGNAEIRPGERDDHLGFDLKLAGLQADAFERGQVDQTIAALGIRDGDARQGGDPTAHAAVREPSDPRHGMRLWGAVTDDETDVGSGGGEEARSILRSVLAIAVQQQDP